MTRRDIFLTTDRLQDIFPVLEFPEAFMVVQAVNRALQDKGFKEHFGTHGTMSLQSAVRKFKKHQKLVTIPLHDELTTAILRASGSSAEDSHAGSEGIS
jgi:hypothetical protein